MGFEIKESATILGMEISNNTANFNSSALKIGEKIKREANWWARFNLSLPGRINVTKSMLYSQLNYLGSFLPFTQEQILLFSDPIENYVRGNLNISKNRIYTEIKNGGLGLCNIKDFLDSQKCGWLTLVKNNNEKWRGILHTKCTGDIHSAISDDFQNTIIIRELTKSLERLREKHVKIDSNFMLAPIFKNKYFKLTYRPLTLADENLIQGNIFKKAVLAQLMEGNSVKSKENLETFLEVPIPPEKYKILKKACNDWYRKYNHENINKRAKTFEAFFNKFKKGSKIFKLCLKNNIPDHVPHNIVKYSKTTDSVIPLTLSKRLNELWTKNIFDSWQKTFIFKLHNNTLGYNIAVSKFVRGHSPLCTFCELSRNPEDKRETPLHLFFQCKHVEPIIQIFFREILANEFENMSRTDFFGGFSYDNSFKNTALDAINILFKQYIWKCKNIKKTA